MSNSEKDPKCQRGCWISAAIAGALIFIILLTIAGKSLIAALFLALLAFGLLGLLFNWLFCAPVPALGAATAAATGVGAAAASASAAPAAKSASAPEAPSAPAKAEQAASAPSDEAASGAAPAPAPASAAASSDVVIKDSAALAGEDELASRKGEWKYEAPAGGTEEAEPEAAQAKGKAKAKRKAAKAAAAEGAGKAAGKAKRKAAKAEAAEGGDAAATAGKGKAKKAKAAKSAKAKAEADATPDFDGDGVREGTGEGAKPDLLSAARAGGADDLKQIKGIGPKLEKVCNEIGVYHFDQIAAWSGDEVAWVNANLIGFKGRVTRDQWVEQAKVLAAGGETEFSKRVEKGSVY